jgi:hypothetical protein
MNDIRVGRRKDRRVDDMCLKRDNDNLWNFNSERESR